jgi:hypothetical protein
VAARALLGALEKTPAGGASDDRDHHNIVSRARPGERLDYVIQERNAELELRLREAEAVKQLYELEFRTLTIASRVNVGYLAYLEAAQDALQRQLGEEANARAGLLAEIERLRSEVAGVSTLLVAVQSRRAYRLVDRAVPVVRRVLFPALYVRRKLRALKVRHAS